MNIGKNRYINYLLFIIAISLFWTCSPELGYGVKSFLFDGVPTPHKVEISVVNDSLQKFDDSTNKNALTSTRNDFYLHEPYKDKDCFSCHDENNKGKLIREPLQLCNECHDDFNKTYEVLHGPVASGNCIACHNPHKSKLKNLLVNSEQGLCLDCHNMTLIFEDKTHKDIEDTSCLECHNTHGGRDNNFLINKQ
tara:strand:- start:3594 stop:4175 length:582 start_codon:yes stop_codon:yes gene_type:complete